MLAHPKNHDPTGYYLVLPFLVTKIIPKTGVPTTLPAGTAVPYMEDNPS